MLAGQTPIISPARAARAHSKAHGRRAARLIDRRPEASTKQVVAATGRGSFQHRRWSPQTRAADGFCGGEVMPRLLLLVPTTSYRISDFLGAARRLDVEVTVGSNRRQVLEKFSPDRTVTLDFRNSEKGTKQIIDFARRYPLQAIVAVDEDTTVLAAKASEALGLPHNSPSSVGAAANKYRFRTVLAEAGLPHQVSPSYPAGRPCRRGPSCRISLRPQAARAFASRGVIRQTIRQGLPPRSIVSQGS